MFHRQSNGIPTLSWENVNIILRLLMILIYFVLSLNVYDHTSGIYLLL